MSNKHNRPSKPSAQPQLFEALEYKDMVGMMKPTIHVDEFASKMGDDDDIIVVSFFVLLLWVPLRIRPGLGTLMNAVQIGLVENVVQDMVPETGNIVLRVCYVAIGMCAIAAGSGLYIGARLGSGPRDGLMLGLNERFGWSIRLSRTLVEITVLVIGVILGGTLGVGTFVFALGIGPMVQVTLRLFRMGERERLAAEGEALEA